MDLDKLRETDMSEEEIESLQDYMANGKPGFMKLTDADTFKWFNLYMNGKSYGEIAQICNTRKDTILYVAAKTQWHDNRLKHYEEISVTLLDKLKRTKLDSVNTVQTIIAALGKYYGDKFNQFLANNDKTVIEDIDIKMLAQYYKSIETLEKILGNTGGGGGGKQPNVQVNVGDSASIKQLEDGSVEITDETAGNLLKQLAQYSKKPKN